METRQTTGKGLLSWRALISLLCFVVLLALAALTLGGHWGTQDWRLDKLNHFRWQYLLGLAALSVFYLFTRRWLQLMLALFFVGWNAVIVISIPNKPRYSEAPVYKTAAFNMMAHNDEVAQIQAWVEAELPDILVLLEATHTQRELYAALEQTYLHNFQRLIGGGYGCVVFSMYPVEELPRRPYPGVGTVPVRIELPEGPLTVVAVHPQAPSDPKAWEWRNRTYRDLAKYIREQQGPLILMGDMNSTQWSPFFTQFEEASGLHQPNVRWLPRRTWPAGMPLLWVPIDHFLVSNDIIPVAEWTGPPCGSDHYPIVMLFRVEEN